MNFLLINSTQWFLPMWAQFVIGVVAVFVAVNIFWTKLLRPTARLISSIDTMVPILKELEKHFLDSPHAFKILGEIIAQFRSDSGSTLRDAINRLEKAAESNAVTSKVLQQNAETARQLAEQDRKQVARLVALLDQVDANVNLNSAGVKRLERGGAVVASELEAAQIRAESVTGAPGEAADAAMRRENK